ncbi:MAG: septum formation inhibitor Maf [Candidatus Sericytochromatia bacterium]|nr:septum formation inhibitor Maf [Candidatus Sericytochromatia bacterium]
MKIVLASASPRRKELLGLIKLEFEIIPSKIDEILDQSLPVNQQIEKISFEKANDIAQKMNQDCVVIGADTVVEINGKILGKPIDQDDAKKMLKMLSGNTHRVITGVSIINTKDNFVVTDHQITEVKFRDLTEEEIDNYVNSGEPMDKAGSYGIQGLGVMIVEGIKGCYTNVVGMPIPLLTKILNEKFSIKTL